MVEVYDSVGDEGLAALGALAEANGRAAFAGAANVGCLILAVTPLLVKWLRNMQQNKASILN